VELDDHGQPVDLWVNERLRVDRSIHEMLGLVKGVLADGVVSDADARALSNWLSANPDAMRVWPGYVLSSRLRKIFEDGVIDETERQDLTELLEATVGTDQIGDECANPTTALPLDVPAPNLVFPGCTYLFTGKFVYGTRDQCQREVVSRGGRCMNRVNRELSVLVIGCIGSRNWAHTSFGRKIESIVKLKREGLPVTVVAEQHWVSQLHNA
jgi:NAD-dependent DNA ligase